MKKSYKENLLNIFLKSGTKNNITEYPDRVSQARHSGPSYRAMKEAVKRAQLKHLCDDDLMRPYQDSNRQQIPAVLLGIADKASLMRVIIKKMKIAENEQRVARYFLTEMAKGEEHLFGKWDFFKTNLNEEDIKGYEIWLEEAYGEMKQEQAKQA